MTLPLSYSREIRCSPALSVEFSSVPPYRSSPDRDIRSTRLSPAMREARRDESNGGEGRIRTFEAARATDLQSAAFDRFATSPTVCILESVCSTLTLRTGTPRSLELAKGFEPPTG